MSGPARFAVLGHPVAHSLSPLMHGAWIAAAGLDARYDAIDPGPDSDQFAAALEGLAGANITLPFKQAAAALAHKREQRVERLGAANVLTRDADGAWAAANTDAPGFVAALDEAAPDWRRRTRSALVIGAGGAGAAILDGLSEVGLSDLVLLNRTRVRAVATAAHVANARAGDWGEMGAAFAHADLIINATSLGFNGAAADWPMAKAKTSAIVVDAVYKPLHTDFLRQAGDHGLQTVDGLGMLIHQGALAFAHWFGHKPDTKAARTLLLGALKERSE